MNFFRYSRQAIRELCPVNGPIAQRTAITVAFAKPSVVQNEHFNAKLAGLSCNGKKLFLIKIKVGGFPVVNENRPFPVTPGPARKPFAVQRMKNGGHTV